MASFGVISFVFVSVFVGIQAAPHPPSRPSEFCDRRDITDEPRLESRQLHGIWFTHRILTNQFASNAFFNFEDASHWAHDWDSRTRNCTYRKFADIQNQNVINGPFSPCFTTNQVLPTPGDGDEFLNLLLEDDVLIFYKCFGALEDDKMQSCSVQPFTRVLTRKVDITRKQLRIAERQLRTFGISIKDFAVIDARENACPMPMQEGTRKRKTSRKGYGISRW